MHRRKYIYGSDVDEFHPERWENDALKNVRWGSLPFNGGPRVWLGQDFALLEAGFTIVRLLQTFVTIDRTEQSFRLPLGEEKHVLKLVVSSGDGCWVRMSRYGAIGSE